MSFADWIKEQIDALRAMIATDDKDGADTIVAGESVEEVEAAGKRIWRFPSNPAYLRHVRKSIEQFCGDAGLDTAACDEIGLVVNEALANVIRHAYDNAKDRPIEMTAEQLNPGVRITLRDWGNGKNPATAMPKEKDPMVPGGLGLICMKQLMDDMHFVPQSDGMQVLMTRTTTGSKAMSVDGNRTP
jgi:serine/threonine-protein kinase RsbW